MNLIKMKCENCGASLEVNKDLDKIHCNFCGSEVLIDDEATKVKRIEEAKLKARKDNHEQDIKERNNKLEQDLREKEVLDKVNAKEKFKKSKFSKVLLIFFGIAVLLFFVGTGFLVKALTLVQAGLFIGAWLMGMEIIKEPLKGLKIILTILAFVLIVPILNTGGDSSYKEEKSIDIDINDIELKEYLPEPKKLFGKLGTNRKDLLILDITNITEKDYKNYVNNQVTEKGYTIDLEYEDWDTVYGAFNIDGYSIRISYLEQGEYMSITLKKPETLEEFSWPANGLGSKLPATKSNMGNISWDNNESFIVHIGNTTLDEYNEYVVECENKGYTIDHSKSKKSYRAKNSDGYELHLMYLGGNVMEVSLKSSDPTNSTDNTDKNGLRTDFKKAMDSYEKFMNDYVEFMKKYSNSDGSDLTLITDYANMLKNYNTYSDEFVKWEDSDLNDAEFKYYVEVQTRVNNKLLSIQ